jgi:hypothetical protein
VSQFEDYSFLPVVVSEVRTIPRSGSEGESNHPENFSLTMLRQGVLPRQRHLLPQQLSRQKMHGRELPEAAWQRTNFPDASTCADPGFAGSRAAQQV